MPPRLAGRSSSLTATRQRSTASCLLGTAGVSGHHGGKLPTELTSAAQHRHVRVAAHVLLFRCCCKIGIFMRHLHFVAVGIPMRASAATYGAYGAFVLPLLGPTIHRTCQLCTDVIEVCVCAMPWRCRRVLLLLQVCEGGGAEGPAVSCCAINTQQPRQGVSPQQHHQVGVAVDCRVGSSQTASTMCACVYIAQLPHHTYL
jgi:hypothetical protein